VLVVSVERYRWSGICLVLFSSSSSWFPWSRIFFCVHVDVGTEPNSGNSGSNDMEADLYYSTKKLTIPIHES
jgi:hypothetical protein